MQPNPLHAPLWRRAAAILYDTFLTLSVMFLAGFLNLVVTISIYGSQELKTMIDHGYNLGGFLFYSILLVTVYGFFGFFWTRSGQTLGMKAWRVKIVNEDGYRLITPTQSIIRFIIAIPAFMLAGSGFFWALIDGKKRTWQDIASSSRVILVEKLDKNA